MAKSEAVDPEDCALSYREDEKLQEFTFNEKRIYEEAFNIQVWI